MKFIDEARIEVQSGKGGDGRGDQARKERARGRA